MNISKELKKNIISELNSFGQIVNRHVEDEYVTVTGTLEELMKYSYDHSIVLSRNAKTESFIKDEDAKYAVIMNGEVLTYYDRRADIEGYGWYHHIGVIEAYDYVDKYQKDNIKRVVVKLNRQTMPDIVNYIESKDNVQGYIIDLIRADMNK